ncbi:Na+/H+ antiporter NhaC family protein, partial [Klebsiella pneumoniae]|uniref:Na+/H+ antiporter NhaC family protein n=1 Tax=Klebsiella pneumoniae TaxID=573 RepID=UPI0030137E58
LKDVTDAVGTADFLVSTVGDSIPAALMPALLFGLCLVIAFATGTSWGTYAVMIPIAMPLAWHIAPEAFFVTLCFSAVIG